MFLHSSQWKQFQKNIGRKTFDLGEGVFVVKLQLPWFGKSYLYSNFVEVFDKSEVIKEIANRENTIFLKVEPMLYNEELVSRLWQSGWRKSGKGLQPQRTTVVNLQMPEKSLLVGMRQKTRYNIRLAQKRGVEVKKSYDKLRDFEKFWQLLQHTAERDKFYTHTKNYYAELLNVEGTGLYFASKGQIPVASAIVMFYKNTATYLHGASSYEHRSLMAPYLLHWDIMQDAQKQGEKFYDFWGIDEEKWPGVTRFKRGFGGKEVQYIGSYDLPTQKIWYMVYRLKNIYR